MAFTGDLELLNIVDIIQLLNSTRKSGTFTVRGSKGESRIIFSNGLMVGASHLNDKVRIGSVLVKMKAITVEDLGQALKVQKDAGKDRKPLIVTLMEMGKLGRDEAMKGLKTLIEMTVVELIGWTKGTFTLDTEAITAAPECSYPISKMEQQISLDAQMVLMDALRIFDERERDRRSGKVVPADEELFSDVLPRTEPAVPGHGAAVLTADDLGLGDLEHMERKIPQYMPADEVFDPAEIHRQKIRETLAAFSHEEQETFVSFLGKYSMGRTAGQGLRGEKGRARGLILFSEDEFIKHSVMTICKAEDVLVFATDGEEELGRIVEQCLRIRVLPVLVFDIPEATGGMLSKEKIVILQQQMKELYPDVPIIQMSSSADYAFILQSFLKGVRAVFPKPSRETGGASFIQDAMAFLETMNAHIKGLFLEQKGASAVDAGLGDLRERILALRDINEPSAVTLALLQYLSEKCERAITFIVRRDELVGEKAIGVYADKKDGATSVTRLKIPLTGSSVFRKVVEEGQWFSGESDDEVLKNHLLDAIGEPLSRTILLLPMRCGGKTLTLTYGDFGGREAVPVDGDEVQIMALFAGLAMENVLNRKRLSTASSH